MAILYADVAIVSGEAVSRDKTVHKAIVVKAETTTKVIRRIKGVERAKTVNVKTIKGIRAIIEPIPIDRTFAGLGDWAF
jgi:hypothetical protein